MKKILPSLAFGLTATCGAYATDIAVSAAVDFDFDASGVYAASSGATVVLPFGDGATVTATALGGAVTTLDAAVNGTNFWTASGGVWALANSKEGEATFCVRYVGAEQGAGTEASPWKFVDSTELSELVDAGDAVAGFVFSVEGPYAVASQMSCPADYIVYPLEDGVYQLVDAPAGTHAVSLAAEFWLDTKEPGPDRRAKRDVPLAFAYSGDDWTRTNLVAASTLSFVSPQGSVEALNGTGTGVEVRPLRKAGVWTVTLSGDSVTTLTAEISVAGGFFLVVR